MSVETIDRLIGQAQAAKQAIEQGLFRDSCPKDFPRVYDFRIGDFWIRDEQCGERETMTPNAKLPPLGDGPRRKMVISISVAADFENRLDNQWMVEREINADRWSWNWADEDTPKL